MGHITLIIISTLCVASTCWASSPLALMWRKVSFENDSGAKVALEVHDEKLVHAVVELHGRRTELPMASLHGVQLPVLNESNLVYSSGVKGDQSTTTITLQIPVLDSSLDVQDAQPTHRYLFIFRDDQFVERWLEERHETHWKVVEVKSFDIEIRADSNRQD